VLQLAFNCAKSVDSEPELKVVLIVLDVSVSEAIGWPRCPKSKAAQPPSKALMTGYG
jgi:hypothetical protein